MSETPTKVVIDCALPDKTRALAATQKGVEATFELIRQGKLTREEGEQRVQTMLDYALEVTGAPDREQVVPLDEAELAQRELDAAEAVKSARRALRAERNGRLRECDWTMLADASLGGTTVEQWKTHRQELRDWMALVTDPYAPPPWPTPPGATTETTTTRTSA